MDDLAELLRQKLQERCRASLTPHSGWAHPFPMYRGEVSAQMFPRSHQVWQGALGWNLCCTIKKICIEKKRVRIEGPVSTPSLAFRLCLGRPATNVPGISSLTALLNPDIYGFGYLSISPIYLFSNRGLLNLAKFLLSLQLQSISELNAMVSCSLTYHDFPPACIENAISQSIKIICIQLSNSWLHHALLCNKKIDSAA